MHNTHMIGKSAYTPYVHMMIDGLSIILSYSRVPHLHTACSDDGRCN